VTSFFANTQDGVKGKEYNGITLIQAKSWYALTEFDVMKCHEVVQMLACKFQGGCFAEGYFV